jgi:murein tripeptide amidase MpaA
MKKPLFYFILAFIISASYGQPGVQQGPSTPGKAAVRKIYTLSGERHGVNYFLQVRLKQVEYEPGDTLKFDCYHTADVIYSWLKKWAEKYPDIVKLYEVGKSFENRPIYQITVTNTKTGKDTDKPAAFFEGGRHSGEVSGSETVLWMARYLIENYGKDPEVTRLVDTKTIYLRPVNNPDGHNLYMNTAQSNRSTVRPEDNDDDGLLDEDAPDDLDGDGIILSMRWKDEKNGTFIPDPRDSTGRIMKRVAAGKGIYSTSTEGIDNDGDGRINEDGIGGLDLHRNYPENWRPQQETTGRGYTQGGAGEYPLSESETRAVVTFLLTHPNVYIVNSMDTAVPMHLRPPSTSPSDERMFAEDLSWYKLFDDIGKKITGYSRAGDVYSDYGGGNPLFGHGPDFGYWYFGAIWYGDEIWNGGRMKDYDKDGQIDQLDMVKWDDEKNSGEGFFEWKPAKHPVYGDVEIGGFDPKFFSQNSPARFIEKWASNEAKFNLEMMKYLPELIWENVEIKKLKSYKGDSADYQLKVTYKNTGKLPTALKQAALVKIVTSDRVVLEITNPQKSDNKPVYKVLGTATAQEERGGRGMISDPERSSRQREMSKNVPYTQGGATGTAVFEIRIYSGNTVSGKASVFSTRGGVLRDREFTIK